MSLSPVKSDGSPSRGRKSEKYPSAAAAAEGPGTPEVTGVKPLATPQSNKEKIAALRQRRSTIKALAEEKKQAHGEDAPAPVPFGNSPAVSAYKKDRARRLKKERAGRKNLFITGFGSFGDIDANPTQQIVEYLGDEYFSIEGYDSYFNVLHVSTGGVDDYLEEREAGLKPGNVNIHIGVHGTATKFALEMYCYNNKDFRIPDSSGKQPEKERIEPLMELDHPLMTDLNVTEICRNLRSQGHDVAVSDDPGRYICNYIYFTSMVQQSNVSKKRGLTLEDDEGSAVGSEVAAAGGGDDFGSDPRSDRNKTIFIHVPPFEIIPKQQQVEFIKAAITLICREDACDRAGAHAKTDSGKTLCEIPGMDCHVDFFDLGCKQS